LTRSWLQARKSKGAIHMRVRSCIFICVLVLTIPIRALANHGPGASGGGSATISGETLNPGHFEISLREDYSQFEHFTKAEAAQRALIGGDFDALSHGFITTADVSYGVFEDFQIGASLGYFIGRNFISAEKTGPGAVDLSTAQPSGLTDMSLTAKYRFLKGQPGNVAFITGVALPTGRSNVRLTSAEPLSPTDQPGTGRFGLPIGMGYSRFLTPHLTIDASALYTFRFEKDDFKVGDRFDTGVALAYRLTESIKAFPQYSLFVELNDVNLEKDRASGAPDPNSGSNTLYATPGFRMRFNPTAAMTIAPSIPIWEHLYGDQGRVNFKLALTFALSY
jgi:hypothetical protein